MKVQVLSDLHLEFRPDFLPGKTDADILILAGDILVVDYLTRSETSPYHKNANKAKEFLLYCANNYKNVIYVMGNHEHYHSRFNETEAKLNNIIKDVNMASLYGTITVLNKSSIMIDDVLFVGGTLWTDCNSGCPITEYTLERRLNDYHCIQMKTPSGIYRKLRIIDTMLEHKNTLTYFDKEINHDKVVVVTHHSPSYLSEDEKYKDRYYENGGYRSDLSGFILERSSIKLWIHGHMHSHSDYMIGNTRVVCNPRGYNDKENPKFDKSMLIEL